MEGYGTMPQGTGRPRKQGGPWTNQENEKLAFLVGRYATAAQVHWVEIAREHGSRDAKQCRERWDNHLKPGLNREKITEAEGEVLLDWVRKHGKHWAPLGRMVNRPENMVKNYFYQENKKAERGITKIRRHDNRHRHRQPPTHDSHPSSVPMSRDNSGSSSHQAYGRSSASPTYGRATDYAPNPTEYHFHSAAGAYYQSASHWAPPQYPSRRTSVTSVATAPSLASDHGSPAESPRAGADIPYPPGQSAYQPWHPHHVETQLPSFHDLTEGSGHKRSDSSSSYGSYYVPLANSPTSLPIHTGFLDRPRPHPATNMSALPSARRDTQPSSPRNAEQAATNSRNVLDKRMSIAHLLTFDSSPGLPPLGSKDW